MTLYLINTDRNATDVPSYDLWFQYRCVFASDYEGHREEHARIFRRLQPTDTLFAYHSGVGYVGVGTVLEEWDKRVYEGGT